MTHPITKSRGRPKKLAVGAADTRSRLLAEARRAFAEHGFAGISLRDLGRRVGLSNAALLHHFPTKERLYGAVLATIELELNQLLDQAAPFDALSSPDQQLRQAASSLFEWTRLNSDANRLLIREMLDSRATQAKRLYLVGPIERLLALIEDADQNNDPTAASFALLQFLSSLGYLSAARPILTRLALAPNLGFEKQQLIEGLMSRLQNPEPNPKSLRRAL